MIPYDEFDASKQHKPLCIACEEMLTDALDGVLSEADQAWFDRHIAGCVSCSDMVADAQRGAAWLEMLKDARPEPSAQLMQRILAETSGRLSSTEGSQADAQAGAQTIGPVTVPTPGSAPQRTNVIPFRPRMPRLAAWPQGMSATMFHPRLAMTAAMAFFSVALTLNMSGVRLNQLSASTLSPAHLKRTYYEANAQAVRYYDNLRVVKVVESRVEDLRGAAEDSNEQERQQEKQQEKQRQKQPAPGPGASRQDSPANVPQAMLNQSRLDLNAVPMAGTGATITEGGLA